nr:hypothetical protein [Tanacetum cinerariifolium]
MMAFQLIVPHWMIIWECVWFRGEVPDTVQLRSTAVMFRKEVEEMVESRRVIWRRLHAAVRKREDDVSQMEY